MLVGGVTVTRGDDAAVGVVRAGRDARAIRVARGAGLRLVRAVVVWAPRGIRQVRGIQRIRQIRGIRCFRQIGSGALGVTGARRPWWSPGCARPRDPIHGSERNRCNA